MRYRVIAITEAGDGRGGHAENAVEAVLKLIELEKFGYTNIVIKQENDGTLTREELLEAAEQEKRDANRT
jgi:hypothetical protein